MSEFLPPERVESTVRAFFESFDRGDTAEMEALLAEDCVFHNPVGFPAIEGAGRIHEFRERLLHYLGDRQFEATVGRILCCGNEAATHLRGRILDAKGTSVDFERIDTFELAPDGRIRVHRVYWDLAGLARRLRS